MTNKFLNSSNFDDDELDNGTVPIFASTLGASALDPSLPVKTDLLKRLYSTKLDVSDINGLSTHAPFTRAGNLITPDLPSGVLGIDQIQTEAGTGEIELKNDLIAYISDDQRFDLKLDSTGTSKFYVTNPNIGVGTQAEIVCEYLRSDSGLFTPEIRNDLGKDITITSEGATQGELKINNVGAGGLDVNIENGSLISSTLTASRLSASGASKELVSTDAHSWLQSSDSSITITDAGNGVANIITNDTIHDFTTVKVNYIQPKGPGNIIQMNNDSNNIILTLNTPDSTYEEYMTFSRGGVSKFWLRLMSTTDEFMIWNNVLVPDKYSLKVDPASNDVYINDDLRVPNGAVISPIITGSTAVDAPLIYTDQILPDSTTDVIIKHGASGSIDIKSDTNVLLGEFSASGINFKGNTDVEGIFTVENGTDTTMNIEADEECNINLKSASTGTSGETLLNLYRDKSTKQWSFGMFKDDWNSLKIKDGGGNIALEFENDKTLYLPYVYNTNVGSGGEAVRVLGTGEMGVDSSIERSKKYIQDLVNVDFIYDLNPVTYYPRKKDKVTKEYTEEVYDNKCYGLIAESVVNVNSELVTYRGENLNGVRYDMLICPMIKCIQELKEEVKERDIKIEQQNTTILNMKNQIMDIMIRLSKLEN